MISCLRTFSFYSATTIARYEIMRSRQNKLTDVGDFSDKPPLPLVEAGEIVERPRFPKPVCQCSKQLQLLMGRFEVSFQLTIQVSYQTILLRFEGWRRMGRA